MLTEFFYIYKLTCIIFGAFNWFFIIVFQFRIIIFFVVLEKNLEVLKFYQTLFINKKGKRVLRK